jgi:hypothetical protein
LHSGGHSANLFPTLKLRIAPTMPRKQENERREHRSQDPEPRMFFPVNCSLASLRETLGYPPSSLFGFSLVASVPAKWLSAKKNIYERTHLWQKSNSAQLPVN